MGAIDVLCTALLCTGALCLVLAMLVGAWYAPTPSQVPAWEDDLLLARHITWRVRCDQLALDNEPLLARHTSHGQPGESFTQEEWAFARAYWARRPR